jgi:hypothetical protein
VGAVIGLGLWLAACSGSSKSSGTTTTDRICEPGSKSCDGLNVKVCSDDGTERNIVQTCAPSQTCADGACAETNCVANTKFCKGGDVWKCDSTGGGSLLSQTCSKSQFCREADDTASCASQTCKPGEPMCDGDTATVCAEDGAGPEPTGTDCKASMETCYGGACQATTCMPGTKLCQDGDVYLCGQNGSDTSLLVDCAAGNVCDGDVAACVPKVCDVGSSGCDGTRAVKCNAYGSNWDAAGTDCATDNQVCVAGSCKKKVCTPGASFCQDGNVFQCDQAGVSSSLSQNCVPYYFCQEYSSSSYAYCTATPCQANQPACDGNVARVCNADGTWPEAGTDCGNDKYCQSGTCVAKICDPGTIFCKDGDIYGCDWLGTSAQLYDTCPADTTCLVSNGNYSCIPLPCSPGETACIGNKVGTCAADGQSIGAVAADCTATSSVCDVDGKCAKTVTDTLGIAEDGTTEYANYVIGDVVKVNSARKLTEMQIDMSLPSPRELRWVVFENTSDSVFTAKQDWIVSNQTGNGFFSSGAISYSLKAGKTYLFAVAIAGGNSTTAVLDTAPFPANVSFGTLLGRVESGYSSVIGAYADQGYLYHMKLTTTP